MLNKEVTYTHWYVMDNMMVAHPPHWADQKEEIGRDAIGMTFRAYIAYKDTCFIEGIKSCFKLKKRKSWLGKLLFGKYYTQIYRTPRHDDNDISRDHVTYAILALLHSGSLKPELISSLRYKISKNWMTPEMYSWLKVIQGNKLWLPVYFTTHFISLFFGFLWNKILYSIGKFGPELPQHEFKAIQNHEKPKWKSKLASMLFPVYAMHIGAWMIYSIPDGYCKRVLSKWMLKLCPEHNYVIQYLMKGYCNPTASNIFEYIKLEDSKGTVKHYQLTDEAYRPMTMSRWTGILNPMINRRDMQVIQDFKALEFNALDKDYLNAVEMLILRKGKV